MLWDSLVLKGCWLWGLFPLPSVLTAAPKLKRASLRKGAVKLSAFLVSCEVAAEPEEAMFQKPAIVLCLWENILAKQRAVCGIL